ncbi:29946_t:CDS:2 [Gigaspora margarita]|uniref:29946_t:CDS:1 n=1 Tax=Gigaspora margarita TaxID=4874 RepID=A0ABN7ULT3_GIGMA|nr:29946_t:CDS:2 [Gigaspora margarita]
MAVSQTWRHADSKSIADRLLLFYAYMPKLITNIKEPHLSVESNKAENLFNKGQVKREDSEDVTHFTNAITEFLLQIEIQNREITELRANIIVQLKDLYRKQCEINEKLIK